MYGLTELMEAKAYLPVGLAQLNQKIQRKKMKMKVEEGRRKKLMRMKWKRK